MSYRLVPDYHEQKVIDLNQVVRTSIACTEVLIV